MCHVKSRLKTVVDSGRIKKSPLCIASDVGRKYVYIVLSDAQPSLFAQLD